MNTIFRIVLVVLHIAAMQLNAYLITFDCVRHDVTGTIVYLYGDDHKADKPQEDVLNIQALRGVLQSKDDLFFQHSLFLIEDTLALSKYEYKDSKQLLRGLISRLGTIIDKPHTVKNIDIRNYMGRAYDFFCGTYGFPNFQAYDPCTVRQGTAINHYDITMQHIAGEVYTLKNRVEAVQATFQRASTIKNIISIHLREAEAAFTLLRDAYNTYCSELGLDNDGSLLGNAISIFLQDRAVPGHLVGDSDTSLKDFAAFISAYPTMESSAWRSQGNALLEKYAWLTGLSCQTYEQTRCYTLFKHLNTMACTLMDLMAYVDIIQGVEEQGFNKVIIIAGATHTANIFNMLLDTGYLKYCIPEVQLSKSFKAL